MQSILIIRGFLNCEFAHTLKFICDSQTNTCGTFMVIHRHVYNSEKFELPEPTRYQLRLTLLANVTKINKYLCVMCAALVERYRYGIILPQKSVVEGIPQQMKLQCK